MRCGRNDPGLLPGRPSRREPGTSGRGPLGRPLRGPALHACAALILALLTAGATARTTTYRCEVDGRVTYGDQPCTTGTQATLAGAPAVDPAERDAATARRRADQAALARLDRDRERERQQDAKAAALAKRRDSDITRNARACTTLALRARNAHDAFDLAKPADQAKARLKMQRADQDLAALCKR